MNKPEGDVHTVGAPARADGGAYQQDAELAALLSRLAALQGHAVPAYRFGMREKTEAGVDLTSLARPVRAQELWVAHFPLGVCDTLTPHQLRKGQFPLLWVAADGARVLLLRGQLSSGHCSTENAQGQVGEMDAGALPQGQVLQLKPSAVAELDLSDMPQTAGDWFLHTVRQYRMVFFDAIVATLILSVVGLVGALYSMQVYDRVVPSKGYSTLVVLTVGALLGVLLELLLKQLRAHMIDRACKAIDQELSAVFFGKALAIRMDARPRTVGTFASQIRYFESVRHFLTSSTLFILADTPFALFFIVIIATISLPVALVPLVLVPLAFLVGALMRQPIEKLTGLNMGAGNTCLIFFVVSLARVDFLC